MNTMPARILPTALAAALAVGVPALCAAEEAATSETTSTLGAALLTGHDADRGFFGQYSGLRDRGGAALLDFSYARFGAGQGTFVRLEGSNLLGRTPEVDFRWRRPADWTLAARFSQQLRQDLLEPSSGPQMELKRTALGLSFTKLVGSRLQFDASVSTENKKGNRLFGVGFNCPSAVAPGCTGSSTIETGWAVLFTPEPVDANHTQAELRAGYMGEQLHLSLGYYGSIYQNAYGSLTPAVPGLLNNAVGTPLPPTPGLQALLAQPVALPPDNQAHQFDLTGSYAFGKATHLNFKLAHTRAEQHQNFAAAGFTAAPAGVEDLGGRVDTTLAQASVSTRPIQPLYLLAKVRFEERNDGTPLRLYNVEGTATYTNRELSSQRIRGQLTAQYQIDPVHRASVSVEQENIDRGAFTATSAVAGLSALRQKTDETLVRVEVRRRVSEDLSGALSVSRSRRDGSNWLRDNSGRGVTEVPDPSDPSVGFATAIFMPTLADRRREAARVQVDWQPAEALALQMSAQYGRDGYSTPSAYGLRNTSNGQAQIDATYAINVRWNLVGGYWYSSETLNQARPGAALMAYANRSRGGHVGLTGRAGQLGELGATLTHVDDQSRFAQTLDATADAASAALLAASGGLPDIQYRQTALKLFGRYDIDKQTNLRLDIAYQRNTWTDWAWGYNGTAFAYSDGTTMNLQPRQRVTFIALRWVRRW